MKRLILMIVCMALLCSLCVPVFAENEATPNRVLTVDAPDSWTRVYAYTWDPEELGAFPGTELVKDGDVYKILVKKSILKLIISGVKADGTPQQTTEIMLEDNGENVTVEVKADCSHRVTEGGSSPSRQPATSDQGVPSEYRVVGNADWMGAWQADNELGIMNEVEPGVYRKTFRDVPPGQYSFVITQGGSWDTTYGDADGLSYNFTLNQTATITIDFVPEREGNQITISGCGTPMLGDSDADENVTVPTDPAKTDPVGTGPAANDPGAAEPDSDANPSPMVNPASTSLYPFLFGILVVCIYLVYLLLRRNRVSGDVTPEGKVYRRPRLSTREVTRAVKETMPAPSPQLDDAVLDAIKNMKTPPTEP